MRKLTPSLREKVWGKTRLGPYFPNVQTRIGEVWYLADRELPLLVKLLFTSAPLSVQVHPADGEDGPRGKTEMWHILGADPGAAIALGFRKPITRERLRHASETGEIENLLNWIPVKPGETYFTPAHTVHAIGAGLVLCEIQQNSDITYRLWDYGRPRELHREQAIRVSDLGVHPGAVAEDVVRCPYFVTRTIRLSPGQEWMPSAHGCHQCICLEGAGTIGAAPYRPGDVWLLPESGPQPPVRSVTASRFLATHVP